VSRFRSRRDQPEPEPLEGDDVLVVVDRAVNPYLVVFHDPSSYRAEQFRGLRNQLIAMNPDGEAKTLVMASAVKGEGKTVSSINLALAFAELERQPVCLVDADLREPSIEDYLNLNPGPGLSDVLLERVPLRTAVRESGIRNLSVLGAGTRLGAPSEVLSAPRIADLFDRLKERFRYVIVDTPPVLPATDASVLAARADGTLFTVRLEYSTKTHTKDAIRNVQDLGANVLGVFVTEVRGADPDNDPRFAYRMRGTDV
jgi:receptor protein-tyrosine kinase/non-specific protein-tyrosine kinase